MKGKAWDGDHAKFNEFCLFISNIVVDPFFPIHTHLPMEAVHYPVCTLQTEGLGVTFQVVRTKWAFSMNLRGENPNCLESLCEKPPGEWPQQRGHSTLPKLRSCLPSWQHVLPPVCLLPHPFLQSFSTYPHHWWSGVCSPDVFPKRLRDHFSSGFTEQMFPFAPLAPNC